MFSILPFRLLAGSSLTSSGVYGWRARVPVRGHDGCVKCPGEESVILCPVGQREKPAELSSRREIHFGPKTDGVRIVVWSQVSLPANHAESIRSPTCWRDRIRRIRKTSLLVSDPKRVFENHRSDTVAKERKIVVHARTPSFAAKLRSQPEIGRPMVDGLQKLLSDPFPGASDICEAVGRNGTPDECACGHRARPAIAQPAKLEVQLDVFRGLVTLSE